jgi:hypothetical protein
VGAFFLKNIPNFKGELAGVLPFSPKSGICRKEILLTG